MVDLVGWSLSAADAAITVITQLYDSAQLTSRDKAVGDGTEAVVHDSKDMRAFEDPQTEADIRSQAIIIGTLSKHFPGVRIVGEEGPDVNALAEKDSLPSAAQDISELVEGRVSEEHQTLDPAQIVLWVDPLDGTKEYILGVLDAVTVLIGISYKGKAIAGVVAQPFAPKLKCWGIVGVGAFGIPLAPIHSDSESRLVIALSRSHMTEDIERRVNLLKPTGRLHIGGAGGKMLRLLQGDVDLYFHPSPGTKKWDTCAPQALLCSAGGVLSDMYGNEIDYADYKNPANKNGLVATFIKARHHSKFLCKS